MNAVERVKHYPQIETEPNEGKAVSELAATVMATAVAKGVAKDVLYFNAWWSGNLAVAWAVAANLSKPK